MITEDYVGYEVAKLLKEKGFDETVRCFYDIQTEILCDNCVKTRNSYTENIAAPTLQMAMKWLRNVHNIHFVVEPFTHDGNKIYYGVNVLDKDLVTVIYENLEDNTHEEACETGIKYCLENLI